MTIQDFKDQFQHHRPTLQGARHEFAVLVPLVEKEDGLYLLYEVRAAKMRRQPGEVCFPGGRMEPGETPVQCALRETWEELGIPESAIEVLGEPDFLYLRTVALMRPVLARVDAAALEHLQLCEGEVDTVFLVPLSYLCDNPPTFYHYKLQPIIENFPYDEVQVPPDYPWAPGRMEVPVYHGLPHPLWGLTARITWWLTETMRQS
ncbi:MAG: CoA pyrophosphatase [Clostridiales bacterium]|nr:CoA pyrophosphatase [Candidatus Cacconaster stercorequi]